MINAFFWGGTFEMIFFVVFFLVLAVFVVTFVKGIGEWSRNNQSPRLCVEAEVAAKRINVSHHLSNHHHGAAGMHTASSTSSTRYYVTFQVESGDRMEFAVNGREYGMLAEGDTGRLSFQGTRYLGFERER